MDPFEQTRYPYEYNEDESYNGQELRREYQNRFPLLAVVTGGDYGNTIFDDFSTGQVYRIHSYTRQRRVVIQETQKKHDHLNHTYLSFPVNTSYTFCVMKKRKEWTEPMSIGEILDKYSCPVMVKYSQEYNRVKVDYGFKTTADIASLLIVTEYEENFFTGNCIRKGVIAPEITLAALSPSISYAEITGIKGKSSVTFQNHLKALERFLLANGVTFDLLAGNPGVTRMTEKGTGSGNPIPEVLSKLIPELKTKRPTTPLNRQVSNPSQTCIYKRPLPPVPVVKPKPKAIAVVAPMSCALQEQTPDDSRGEYMYLEMDGVSKETTKKSEMVRKSLEQCSMSAIKRHLSDLQLQKYANKFEEQRVDGMIFVDLTREILEKEFHMSQLEILRLLMFIKTGHIPR
ncbi:uncharacterized protein LOC132563286 [Ylistrum balloti]|uniref:uncharacterized protein LOC132563286 n=1 Tax=Ylistrum balloti TaxID=509963 RepID=UPI002905ED15|nr:uncharacterized protein LOC132563286 [Ylistrum balloti]